MKEQHYILKIENPCSQEWHSMTASEQGKFCNKCSKNVVDFSNLSDTEIAKRIKNSEGRICGRLNTTQTNRVLSLANYKASTIQNYKFIASLLLLVPISTAQAQTIISNEIVVTKKDKSSNIENDSSKTIISGMVVDSVTKETLPGAVIIIQGTQKGASADLDGYFKLNISDFTEADKLTFEVFYVGYKKKIFSLSKSEFANQTLLMIPETKMGPELNTMIVGEMTVVYKSENKKWWRFWKRH